MCVVISYRSQELPVIVCKVSCVTIKLASRDGGNPKLGVDSGRTLRSDPISNYIFSGSICRLVEYLHAGM